MSSAIKNVVEHDYSDDDDDDDDDDDGNGNEK